MVKSTAFSPELDSYSKANNFAIVETSFKQEDDDEERNVVRGHASVFGNVDQDGDVMAPGAFKKTVAERVPSGRVKMFDSHIWTVDKTLGTVIEAEEDDEGLFFKAKLSNDPEVQRAKLKMIEGHIDRMSIGFDILDSEFDTIEVDGEDLHVRVIKEIKLYEVSAVPIAANELATIEDVKSFKGVPQFRDLPLSDFDHDWDHRGAVERVKEWASAEGGGEVNVSQYRRAFLHYDTKEPSVVDKYKLPIADVIDGKLMAVPKGIFKAAAAVEGDCKATGIGKNKPGIRKHIEKYYDKMDLEAPWEEGSATGFVSAYEQGRISEDDTIKAIGQVVQKMGGDDQAILKKIVDRRVAAKQPKQTKEKKECKRQTESERLKAKERELELEAKFR